MSTAEIKLTIFELLAATKDSKVLNSIYKQLKSQTVKKEADFWDELTEEQKVGIERGLKDIKAGRVYTHEQVIGKSKTVISRYKKLAK